VFQASFAINKKVDNADLKPGKNACSKNNHIAASHDLKGSQPATPTLFTASSTANGDKSKP
jgi:hypothetical protein